MAGGLSESDPATTYFPAWCSSIIGAEGLTAVFGMGTGVAPLLWSPEHNLMGDGCAEETPGPLDGEGVNCRGQAVGGLVPVS